MVQNIIALTIVFVALGYVIFSVFRKREDLLKGMSSKLKNDNKGFTDLTNDLLKQYRNLCEENKLTINILIQRLLAHEKGRE